MKLLRKKKKQKLEPMRPLKDTLVIIGNGFDRWQGLDTSYASFAKYYEMHKDEILKKLHLKKTKLVYEDGEVRYVTPVEMIYGDPFQPEKLDEEFWSHFEDSLKEIDDERINLFFGKEKNDLKDLNWYVRSAYKILKESFCSWIQSIKVEENPQELAFGDNCVFINFNYTDTLEKRFHIPAQDIIHIHGEATDRDSIIVGHASHPHEPEYMLYKLGGRFRGLYYIESILFETDKHVQDNIQNLIFELAIRGVIAEDIKHIYVLGHSFGMVDAEYFIFFKNCTSIDEEEEQEKKPAEENDPLEELHNRMQYAMHHNKRSEIGDHVTEEMYDAVQRRFNKEQAYRNDKFEKMFYKIVLGKSKRKAEREAQITRKSRSFNAKWHISYYSEMDEKWISHFMNTIECKDFTLYSSIEECMKS